MRSIISIWFFLAICVAARQSYAQSTTCNGSLGDPVFTEDFGAGTNPGAPLGAGITTLKDTDANCPNDGYYTIANSITGSGNCHPATWYDVPSDHTGNPNGYMMIINASYLPSIFYERTVTGLCPGTTYYFQAYILNLCIPSFITAAYTQPNITFSILDPATQKPLVPNVTTGNITPTPYFQGPTWIPYGMSFTTPNNAGSVLLVMTNNSPGGNGNDFILDDITFRACGPVINLGFSSPIGPATKSLCQGIGANYILQASVNNGSNTAVKWQQNTGSGWTDIAGQTGSIYSINIPPNTAPGTYQYRAGISNGSSNSAQCRVYSQPVTVDVTPTPVVPAIAPQLVCEGNTLQITASGGASYVWTGPNLPPTTQNPLIISNATTANAGTYSVTAFSADNCSSQPVPVQVQVLPQVVGGISSDVAICSGQSTQLNATGGLYYQWAPSTGLSNDAVSNPMASPGQTTTYTVTIGNGGCNVLKSVTVTVNQSPVAKAGDNFAVFEGQSATLHGTITGDNITSYYWTPATFLDNPNSLTPITTPTDNITYTLTAVSKTCGTSTSSVSVRVYKKITVPNTFSPNSDGINDYWNIDALVTYPDCSVMVYNRYGEQVYQSTGYAKPWDGTYSGAALPAGTYYYIIDLKNNTPKVSGWVLIVR